jgi:tRNA dimethylallyltransferase
MSLEVLTIVGPTASGKTRLAVEVAHRLHSEIISADSRQVYRGLDIGTGKDLGEYASVTPPVPVHLIDVSDPNEVYSLFQYQQDCYRVLRKMEQRAPFSDGETPVLLVGGSGLYIEAVVRDFRIADVPANSELRQRLRDRDHEELSAQLKQRWPDLAVETDMSSRRRVVRALEIAEHRETHPARFGAAPGLDLRFLVYGIDVPRAELRRRIGRRLRTRIEEGMVEEVEALLDRGLSPRRLDDLGLEYREISAYLLGEKTWDRMISDLETAIGRFAKRQQTWFRGMERRGVPMRWIGPHGADEILAACGGRP